MSQNTSYTTNQIRRIRERLSNPFPGLRPFGIDEAHMFFGREGQSDEILYKLAENRFVAVLGFSGSGKSSLIYCGLVPILHGGFMTSAGSNWRILVMRPGTSPIDNLAETMVLRDDEYDSYSPEERVVKKTILSTILRSSSLGLMEASKHMKTSENENTLIVVDQFEEIFRYKSIESKQSGIDESSLFVNLLVEAVRRQTQPIYITLTMRSDFIGDCAVFGGLTQMINDSHYLIPQMNRDQKRRAIEGPIAVGNGLVAPRLVQQLLNDVGESPDQLPILQHALMRTWQYWQTNRRNQEPIDLHHYSSIGALTEALSQHANEAFDSLTQREQKICEVLFKALTEKGGEGKMIRRPTKLSVLSGIAGVSEEDITRVIDRFREPGRTLLMPSEETTLDSSTVVDISHESLMRIWLRLKAWVEEESRSAGMYLKLTEASDRYQQGVTGLWKMPDLQLALNWKQETRPTLLWGKRYHPAFERTMVFLDTSRRTYENEQIHNEKRQRAKLRRMRIGFLASVVGALVCVFLAFLASQRTEESERAQLQAEEAFGEAQKQAEEAKRQEKIALQASSVADRERLKAEKSAEIAKVQEQQARSAQAEAERQTALASEALATAEREKDRAEREKDNAEVARKNAEESALAAQRATSRADNLYYQALAQGMGTRVEAIRDPVLKSLVAMQAHLFYDEYGDKPYNADIYEGVYDAYKAVEGDSINYWSAHGGNVRGIAVATDGQQDVIYSGGSDGRVYAWSVGNEADSKLVVDLQDEDAILNVVRLLPKSNRLLVTGNTGAANTIYLVDLVSQRVVGELPAPSAVIYDLVVLPGEREYLSVGNNRIVFKGSLTAPQQAILYNSPEKIKSISYQPLSNTLAMADERGSVNLLNTKTLKTERVHDGEYGIHAVQFSPKGDILAFGDETGKLFLWNTESRSFITDLNAHYRRITDLRFSKDQRLMVSSSWDRTAKVWDLENINDLPITLDDHSDWVWGADFADDGKQVLTASSDNLLRIYPTQAQDMVANLCARAGRNFEEKEWKQYVSAGEPYRVTCENLPKDGE